MTSKSKLHQCDLNSPYGACGEAINTCLESEDLTLWAGNGEYDSQVNYCPVCGYEAKKKVGTNDQV